MGLNIKNPNVERLATEVAELTGESKTEAIRRALEERRARLKRRPAKKKTLQETYRFLEKEIWSKIPPSELGKTLTREEIDDILGYGPDGV